MKHKKEEEETEDKCEHEHHGLGPLEMIKMPDPGVPLILSTGIDERAARAGVWR